MSRGEHIGRCQSCGKEYRWGDCFTAFCFEHDPEKAFERTLMKTAIRPGESQPDYVERVFPIQSRGYPGSPSAIPWRLLDEGWAQHNHGQTLRELANRGGLGACEAMANIERRAWRRMDDAGQQLAAVVKADEIGKLRDEITRYRRAIDQIGFRLAGTELDPISKRCLAVLGGETLDGLPIQPHHHV